MHPRDCDHGVVNTQGLDARHRAPAGAHGNTVVGDYHDSAFGIEPGAPDDPRFDGAAAQAFAPPPEMSEVAFASADVDDIRATTGLMPAVGDGSPVGGSMFGQTTGMQT